MARKSLFGRLANALKEEETAEDIDKDVEAAVMATMAEKVGSLDGSVVLHPGTGELGKTVYIFDLAPVYKMIGGDQSRSAAGLLEICERRFEAYREHNLDMARVKGDHYIMRFAKVSNEAGYRRAVLIINEIGTQLLSDRFNKLEVPEILVAADVKDITNADGEVQTEQIGDVQKKGGVPIDPRKLGDLPGWAKFVVTKNARTAWEFSQRKKKKNDVFEMVEIKHTKASKHDDIKMVEIENKKKRDPDWFSKAMKAD